MYMAERGPQLRSPGFKEKIFYSVYVCQTIMLYMLDSLQFCQFYLYKAGAKKKIKISFAKKMSYTTLNQGLTYFFYKGPNSK